MSAFGKSWGSSWGVSWGGIGSIPVTSVNPAEVWGYVLPGGQTTGQAWVALLLWARDLHKIHGLAEPLLVSSTARAASYITQLVDETGAVVTVTRQ